MPSNRKPKPKSKRIKAKVTVSASKMPPPSLVSVASSGSCSNSKINDSVGTGWYKCLRTVKNGEWLANVTSFKSAPFASRWNEFAKTGMVVELPISLSQFSDKNLPVYWLGRVVCFAGYYALVEFLPIEGDTEPQKVMWVPFFTNFPKPFGYCMENEILLHPVSKSVINPTNEVKKTLESLMANSLESLPPDYIELLKNEIKSVSTRFQINEIVEALDRTDCSQFRLAKVNIIVGDRLQISYCDMEKWDEGFWFSQNSSSIHKLGWCQTVGAKLLGSPKELIHPIPNRTEFASIPDGLGAKVERQMIFEMRHPVLPHKMVCGYIAKLLKHGYFLAGTDWTDAKELVEVVMHITSDYILPLNFCRDHRINLRPPVEKGETLPKLFSWREYLQKQNCKELPLPRKNVTNPFTQGSKLEAVNILSPVRLQPATIIQVAGNLLYIHFDGYSRLDETSYQWVSCQSSSIYPAGYSEMIGYKMTGRTEAPNHIDHLILQRLRPN